MAGNVTDRDLGWKKIQQELIRSADKFVAVGILSGSKNADGASIAEYAAYNEYGTSTTPERPFMRTSFDESQDAIRSDTDKQYGLIVSGKTTAHRALTVIGQKHADRIKNVITGRDFLPQLADSTVRGKKGSTKTLVDTGAMVNAVQISVRNK